jgi:hypothetical protein
MKRSEMLYKPWPLKSLRFDDVRSTKNYRLRVSLNLLQGFSPGIEAQS